MPYSTDVLIGVDMYDYIGRTAAVKDWEGGRFGDLAATLDLVRELCVRCGPSAALFTAFCVAWALVFEVALR